MHKNLLFVLWQVLLVGLLTAHASYAQDIIMSGSPVSTCAAIFRDPGGAGNYSNSMNVVQTFSPGTSGAKLKVTFSALDLEQGYDKLYVYDGASITAPLLGTYTGSTFNGVPLPPTLTATNAAGQLTFQFTSDVSYVRSGWQATLHCGQLAEITLSNTAHVYNNSPKPVTVTTTPAGLTTSVTYNGSTTVPTNVGVYSVMAVVTSPGYNGISFGTLIIDPVTAVNMSTARVSTCTAIFRDPGGASNYSDDTDVVQTFSPGTPGAKLQVTFSAFDLEQGYDYLYVYDGGDVTAPTMGVFTGSTLPGTLTATNAAGQLTFQFQSDGSITNPGWQATVYCGQWAPVTISNTAQVYNGTSRPVTVATTPTGLATSVTYNGSATVPVNAGTYTVVAMVTAPNYSGFANSTLTIGKAPLLIKANDLSRPYGSANPALTFTCTGFVNGETVSVIDAAPTLTTTATLTSPVGSYPITPAGGSDNNYNITLQNGTLTVTKANQTVSLAAIPAKTFGDAAFTLSATASSGLPVTYSSSNTAVATVSGNTVTIVGAGTATITATQAGDLNYNAATATQTLTVGKATPLVTWATPAGITYGTALSSTQLNATASFRGTALAGTFTYSPAIGAIPAAGNQTLSVTFTPQNTTNFNPATATVVLAVAKAAQTISFAALANKVLGDADFALTATATSGLPVSFSIVSGPATVTGNTLTLTGVGTVTVRASQAGNGNYNAAAPVDQSFTVGKGNQTISFAAPANKAFGDADFALTATATSGLPVQFEVVSGPAAISGNTLTLTGVGTVTVRASQAGNGNYNAAAPVEQSFTVGKGNQTISFAAPANKAFGDADFALTATATSGLPVSFSIVSGPATVTGNTLTLTGAGTVTVKAFQDGNGNYEAAAPVEQSFCVLPVKPVITASGATLSATPAAGYQWYLNGEVITGATQQTFIASAQGLYTVAIVGACGGQVVSEAFTISVSGTESPISSKVVLYPNPAVEKVVLELPGGVTWQHARIVALGGNVVDQQQGNAASSVVFATGTLAKGMYILEVRTAQGLIRKKFMVR